MIRDDTYGMYNNKEYRLVEKENGLCILVTTDNTEVKNGFEPIGNNKYVKIVNRSDIQSIYRILTYARYKGYKVYIFSENDGKFLITSDDMETIQKLGFETISWGDYGKWVFPSELEEIWEEKRPRK